MEMRNFFITALFASAVAFSFAASRISAQSADRPPVQFYARLQNEIDAVTPPRERARYRAELEAKNFLRTDLNAVAGIRNNRALLTALQRIQLRYKQEFGRMASTPDQNGGQQATTQSALGWNSFIWNFPYISARAGVDYYYIDPGYLLPKNENVTINTYPLYYYDLRTGLRFNFFGFDLRVKNSLEQTSLKDDYLNREDIASREEEAKTRERLLSLVGFFTPFKFRTGSQYSIGLYTNSEYRLFQTEVVVSQPTVFKDRTQTITLNPGEQNLVNMFQQSYTIGLVLAKTDYKVAFGYRYTQIDAPLYVREDDAVEMISSKTHSGYIYVESKYRGLRFACEGTYGLSRFEKPDGETVHYIYDYSRNQQQVAVDTDLFYRSQVRNTYSMTFYNHLTIGAYLGYSGYIPVYNQSMSTIAISLAAQAFGYYETIANNGVAILQTPAEILASYYLVKRMQGDVFYGEIMAGIQAGISF